MKFLQKLYDIYEKNYLEVLQKTLIFEKFLPIEKLCSQVELQSLILMLKNAFSDLLRRCLNFAFSCNNIFTLINQREISATRSIVQYIKFNEPENG